DPDMFVSRAHCKINGGRDGYFVTDTSSSGLFIDDSDSPLGAGRSTRLQSGMRLRLGDYVLYVEVQPSASQTSVGQAVNHSAPAWSQPQPRSSPSIGGDDFFSARVEEEPRRPRPADLPDPFEQPVPGAYDFSFGPAAAPASVKNAQPAGHGEQPAAEKPQAAHPWDMPARAVEPPPPRPASAPRPSRAAQPAPDDMALRAAFLRGMGVEEADFPGRDPIAEMEKFGREYRLMLDGLMQLLRKRAEEKGSARVAQTIVGASEVNPLKFLPTVEDVIVTIISERSPGFLSGDAAISDAVKDLAQHHVRAWRGVQAALRRMIDRFDPAAIEEELKSNSALGNLLSG
ncbi:MAG: type VI secretion system-associated FHA domain protein TagH, partial [Mesorhizobium sp.]